MYVGKIYKFFVFFFLLFSCTIANLSSFAGGTTAGISMGASEMEIAPIEGISSDDQYFKKTSMNFFTNSSFFREVLLLNTKMELISIQKEALTVNHTHFPKLENQGIRSFEMTSMFYIGTFFGWRQHVNLGYNTKGYEKNNSILFALNKAEKVTGITLIRRRKPKYDIEHLVNDMMGISERTTKIISANKYFGDLYTADELSLTYIQPVYRNINLKCMGKIKEYKTETNAPRKFLDEKKLLGGIIIKGQNNHTLSFDIYHDFNLKETGTTIGYLYYIPHKENSFTRAYDHLRTKYKNLNHGHEKVQHDASKEDIREIVVDILEDAQIL